MRERINPAVWALRRVAMLRDQCRHSTYPVDSRAVLGLPIRSPNCRSFCGGFGPIRSTTTLSRRPAYARAASSRPRSTGRSGDRESCEGRERILGFGGPNPRMFSRERAGASPPGERATPLLKTGADILAAAARNPNVTLARLPISRSPCESRGSWHELSARQQPEACRTARPRDATEASASDLRLGSPKRCGTVGRGGGAGSWPRRATPKPLGSRPQSRRA